MRPNAATRVSFNSHRAAPESQFDAVAIVRPLDRLRPSLPRFGPVVLKMRVTSCAGGSAADLETSVHDAFSGCSELHAWLLFNRHRGNCDFVCPDD